MKDKTQYEALMEELKKIANNFKDVVTELGDILAKILPDVEIPDEEEEETWEMKYPYEIGDEYWNMLWGRVKKNTWDWIDCERTSFEAGEIFPTEEAAELELKRRKLLTRFRAFRDECNGDWKADWGKDDEKFYLYHLSVVDMIMFDSCCSCESFFLFGYFKNSEDCERAIELFGDEIKALFVDCEAQ